LFVIGRNTERERDIHEIGAHSTKQEILGTLEFELSSFNRGEARSERKSFARERLFALREFARTLCAVPHRYRTLGERDPFE
jgi:hypothetical protein